MMCLGCVWPKKCFAKLSICVELEQVTLGKNYFLIIFDFTDALKSSDNFKTILKLFEIIWNLFVNCFERIVRLKQFCDSSYIFWPIFDPVIQYKSRKIKQDHKLENSFWCAQNFEWIHLCRHGSPTNTHQAKPFQRNTGKKSFKTFLGIQPNFSFSFLRTSWMTRIAKSWIRILDQFTLEIQGVNDLNQPPWIFHLQVLVCSSKAIPGLSHEFVFFRWRRPKVWDRWIRKSARLQRRRCWRSGPWRFTYSRNHDARHAWFLSLNGVFRFRNSLLDG